jgi:arginyl-tRNA synthetase
LHKKIKNLFIESAKTSLKSVTKDLAESFQLERTKKRIFGDFSSNIAMVHAKAESLRPIELAKEIIVNIPNNDLIDKMEVAGPGFINIYLKSSIYHETLKNIVLHPLLFGHQKKDNPRKILVEFVSANPTGPLHVGHGRGAAFGSSLINILKAMGDDVYSEYYVNDGGRQMDILAISIYLKYLLLNDTELRYPSNCYQAQYIDEMALRINDIHKNQFASYADDIIKILIDDQEDEARLDALIKNAKATLKLDYKVFFNLGLDTMLKDIKNDLEEFGVTFDSWVSEKVFLNEKKVEGAIALLEKNGFTYIQDGATWFASERCGDDKDRVLYRENGAPTYFACDLAYHLDKLDRNFDEIIDIWGADHHGYIQRVKSSIRAAGYDDSKLKVLLIQFVSLFKDSKKLQMSTRSANYITLRELRREVGNDAARLFYTSRSNDQHLDFDMTLAQKQSNENPVFYIQYAHARTSSIIQNQQLPIASILKDADPSFLISDQEIALMVELAKFPEIIEHASHHYAPQYLIAYLSEIASLFHSNYAANKILIEDSSLRNSRIMLCYASKCVIKNGLTMLGVYAPESM